MSKNFRLFLLLAVFVVVNIALPASAAVCAKRIISYWGWVYPDTVSCNPVIGPKLPAEVVGQTIRECDGYTWSWGRTDCTYVAPTTEYQECENCFDRAASQDGEVNGTPQRAETAEAVVACPNR